MIPAAHDETETFELVRGAMWKLQARYQAEDAGVASDAYRSWVRVASFMNALLAIAIDALPPDRRRSIIRTLEDTASEDEMLRLAKRVVRVG